MGALRWVTVAGFGAIVGGGVIGLARAGHYVWGGLGALMFFAPLTAAVAGTVVGGTARAALAAGVAGALAGGLVLIPLASDWNDSVDEPLLGPEFIAVLCMVVGMLPVGLFCLGVWAWRSARHPEP